MRKKCRRHQAGSVKMNVSALLDADIYVVFLLIDF
ncbi:hypothetical protein R75483_01357 [Paraburkholderia domus]|nr:hypothetical protein R75483_01357 [Paraburkholderia domus]